MEESFIIFFNSIDAISCNSRLKEHTDPFEKWMNGIKRIVEAKNRKKEILPNKDKNYKKVDITIANQVVLEGAKLNQSNGFGIVS